MDLQTQFLLVIISILIAYTSWWWFREGKSLKGKICVVTGGGLGIGRLMALRLAKEGAIVVVLDIREQSINSVVKEIESLGGKAFGYVCDVSQPTMIKSVAEKIKKEVGRVYLLINNAGIVIGKLLLELDEESIRKTFDVNTLGLFWMTRAFLDDMVKYDEGHIVNICSSLGHVTGAYLTDYCSSKFAAIGFHESLRMDLREMKKYGIKTTMVCPHMINTGMFDGAKTKFQFLAPVLEPDYVARKIIEAVKTDQMVLMLPRFVYLFTTAKNLLPAWLLDVLIDFMGATNTMRSFKGRGPQINTKSNVNNKKVE